VLTDVAPCGLHDRAAGRLGYTPALGFPEQLAHIIAHTRQPGGGPNPRFVLAQGTAAVYLTPVPRRLVDLRPAAERFLGPGRHGPVWDRLLREYDAERVFVDVDVTRVTVRPDLAAPGSRVDVTRAARALAA
jgi:hypothetical protein